MCTIQQCNSTGSFAGLIWWAASYMFMRREPLSCSMFPPDAQFDYEASGSNCD